MLWIGDRKRDTDRKLKNGNTSKVWNRGFNVQTSSYVLVLPAHQPRAHSPVGYGYGYMVGALPRGRCARSMAGFADTKYLLTVGRYVWSAPGYRYRGRCMVCVPRAGTAGQPPPRDVVCGARQAEVYGTQVSSVVLILFVCRCIVCDSHHGPGSHVRSSLHIPAFTAPTGASPASRHSYRALTMRSVVRGPTSMPLFSVIFCSCLLRATY